MSRDDLDPTLDGNRRLPTGVRPTHCALVLWLDPDAATFEGEVTIEVVVDAPVKRLSLHGREMTLLSAAATRAEGEDDAPGEGAAVVELSARFGPAGALALDATAPLAAGRWRLRLRWRAPIGTVPEGIYRVRRDGHAYLFTQFEPLAARRVFPCFDEPAFKIPFVVTLVTPRGLVALANTPRLSTAADGGRDRHVFAPTPPLPTYLVAFAVGPFDVRAAEPVAGEAPIRVVTTRGAGHLADFALDVTPPLVASLARRCGRPMPYAKLDLVGVPDFAAGAMENVGLVTFRERLLLLDAKTASASDRMWASIVIAHELAHMWFGNLVTMGWWDDLWLNEAFATDLETRVVDDVAPGFDAGLDAIRETGAVMEHDALAEARAVRQPIADGGDVLNAFDGITYGKGAALLRMTRHWLGDAAFDAGVSAYLDAHAHGTAGTDDLLGALQKASGAPVRAVLGTFLDQPGVPLVSVAPVEDDPRTIELRQSRFGLHGQAPTVPWRVPLVLLHGRGERVERTPVMLERPVQRVTLDAAPEWLHPNADEAAYVRWQLRPEALTALVAARRDHLGPAERVALPSQLWAQLEIGALSIEALLDAYTLLADDPHRLVLGGVMRALRHLGRRALPESHRAAFAAWIRDRFGPHLARLGAEPRADESDHDRLLRPEIVEMLADQGEDDALIEAMAKTTHALLDALADADAGRLQSAAPVAALQGDAALFDRLAEALPRAPAPGHRVAIIRALGSFGDRALAERGFASFFGDELRAQDVFTLLRPAGRRPDTRRWLLEWLDAHHARLAVKIGDEMAAHLPELFNGCTTLDERTRVVGFFAAPERRPPGLERLLRQTLEGIDRNIQLAARIGSGLAAYLDERGAQPKTGRA
ncbi:MAG: M1 family metallopeptidase [Myxococcales bacterium]|nr:M1 family metallopeptidase [Myxococcales bacterium]